MTAVIKDIPDVEHSVWIWTAIGSIVVHIVLLALASPHVASSEKAYQKVKMTVTEAVPLPVEPKPIEKPLEKPKKKSKATPTPNETVANAKADTPPIQGVTKDSVSDKGTMAAPVGNTLMVEDTGKRMNPEDVGALKGDMSAPASLIRDSVNSPPYTEQALDASLEGSWVVDVYVDISGNVASAELRRKIGYGMDERVLTAARQARFSPRKNKYGASEAGWAEIKFTLVIP